MKRFKLLLIILIIIGSIPLPYPSPNPIAADGESTITVTFSDASPIEFDDGTITIQAADINNNDPPGDPFAEPEPDLLPLDTTMPTRYADYTNYQDNGDGTYTFTGAGCYVNTYSQGIQEFQADTTENWLFDWITPEGSQNNGGVYVNYVILGTDGGQISNYYGNRVWHEAMSWPNYPLEPEWGVISIIWGAASCMDVTGRFYTQDAKIKITFVFDGETTVSQIDFDHRNGTADYPYSVTVDSSTYDYTFSSGDFWDHHTESELELTGTTFEIEFPGTSNLDIDDLELTYVPPTETEPTPTHYVRPLMPDDERDFTDRSGVGIGSWEWGTFATFYPEAVISQTMYQPFLESYTNLIPFTYSGPGSAFVDGNELAIYFESQTLGAPIHAAADAVVIDVEQLTLADCERGEEASRFTEEEYPTMLEMILAEIDLMNLLAFIADNNSYETQQICELFQSNPSVVPKARYSKNIMAAGHIVTIQINNDGRYLSYLVGDPTVLIGQPISAGCVLGYTVPAVETDEYLMTGFTSATGAGLGVIWAEEGGEPYDLRGDFVQWPWSNESCGGPDFGDCLNLNPTFTDPGGGTWWWQFADEAARNPTGETTGLYLMSTGENDATQTLAASDVPYSIKIAGYVAVPEGDSTDSSVDVTFGDTTHTVTFPADGALVEFVTDLQDYDDSDYSASIFDLEIEMTDGEDGAVVITFLCIDDTADPISDMPSCIVLNPGFDNEDYWTLTDASPNYPEITSGSLTLPQYTAAETEIDVQLRPDTYTVELKMRGLPLLVPPVGGEYDARVDWSLYDPDENYIGDGYAVATTDQFEVLDAGEFTVSSLTDPYAVFTLSANNTTDTAQIDYVCLIPQNLDVEDGPSKIDCNSCPRTYIGDLIHDVPEAVDWLACELNRTYYCDARQIMIDTQEAAEDAVRGIGMMGRWLSATLSRQGKFFWSLGYFLGGYLNNVGLMIQDAFFYSGGAATYIYEDQPTSIFDVLAILIGGLRDVLTNLINGIVQVVSYLVPLAEIFRDIALGLFSLIENVIDTIAALVSNVISIVGAIINAVDADPATIEGVPNCAADLASGEANVICWGFYILDNTIWSGPAGYLMPIFIAAAALNLLIWVFDQFKDAITNAS